MGAYAMGAPWLRFNLDCGDEAEQRLREVWAQMTGKTRTGRRSAPPWAGMGHGFGGPGFGGPPWARGMRGPKARRGDVRAAILSVLADQPRNGYQVIQEIAERTSGAWKPSPGSIYPTLQQLEDEGLVVQVEEGGRKAYALTDDGRDYVSSHPEEMAAPWAAMSDNDTDGDLRPLLGQVAAAMWQVMAVGSPEQQAAAKDAIVELRKTLYGILADGDTDGSDDADRR
ncbi:MAG TPA: PadR family transcriptional regulator [Microlunatus sp.]|nr:PadR family transcriptional regulator [Microlunatus sp.]